MVQQKLSMSISFFQYYNSIKCSRKKTASNQDSTPLPVIITFRWIELAGKQLSIAFKSIFNAFPHLIFIWEN